MAKRDIVLNIKINDDQADASVKRLNKEIERIGITAVSSGSVLKSAFSSFAGNLLSTAVTTGVSAINSLITSVKDLGLQAIQAGADFEQTRNAIQVFSGGAVAAQKDLKDLENLARNTPGLGLETAEKGFLRLRSVGFEAKLAKDFLEGLSKVKILSGGTQDDLEAVLYNLVQVKAQGKLTGDELKESLGRLPALAPIIQNAFGTINTKKIAELNLTSGQFFDRLNSALKNTAGASGGLNDAWQKLQDQVLTIGREFSKPILQPLTRSITEMTTGLGESKNAWADWGQYVGDIITGLEVKRREGQQKSAAFAIQQEKLANMSFWEKTAFRSRFQKDSDIPVSQKEIQEYLKRNGGTGTIGFVDNLAEIGKKERLANTPKVLNKDFSNSPSDLLESVYGVTSENKNATDEIAAQAEIFRQKQLERIDAYYSQIKNIRQTAFDLEVAQNANNSEKVFQITQSDFQKQISETLAFYNQKIKLSGTDADAIFALEIEKNNSVRELQTKQAVEQINFDRQQNEKRRQVYLEFKQLQLREVSSILDSQLFDAQRAIDREISSYSEGYNELIELTQKRFNIISQITSEQYQTRLQDETLNAQQRVNLEKEMSLSLQDLAEENRRKLIEISDRQYEQQISQLENYQSEVSERYKDLADTYATIGSAFFNPDTFNSNTLGKFQENILKQSQTSSLTEQIKLAKNEVQKLQKAYYALSSDDVNFAKTEQAFTTVKQKAFDLEQQLENLQKSIPSAFNSLGQFAEQISKGSIKAFDEASKKILEYRQLIEREDLKFEIGATKDLIQHAKLDAKLAQDTVKQKEYEIKLTKLLRDQEKLGLSQSIELTEHYNDSLEGLTATLKDLRNGSKAAFAGLEYNAQKAVLTEQIGLFQEIVNLKARIANIDGIGALNAQRKELEYIAQNIKTLDESFADFKITIADGIVQQINQPFDKLRDSLKDLPPIVKGIATAFIDLANQIVLAFSQKIIMQLFGLGSGSNGGSSSSGGGWLNGILKAIGIGGGGSNIGGTPSFNPNRFSGAETFTGNGAISVPFLGSSNGTSFGGGGGMWGGWNDIKAERDAVNKGKFGLKDGMALGAIGLQIIGSLIKGRVGNTVSMAGTGMSLGMAIGSAIPVLGTVIGGLIGGGVGALFGWLMGDPKQKVDKRENMPKLQEVFTDALKQLRELAADKNSLFNDPAGAISKANELRAQIASGGGVKMESKKYKQIAQQQIASKLIEADEIIKNIREMADSATIASDVDKRLETNFASGVFMDKKFMSQYGQFKRRNGFLGGTWTSRDYLPSLLADGEFVINPKQASKMREKAGFDIFAHGNIPNYSQGTFVTPSPRVSVPSVTGTSADSSAPNQSKQPIVIKLYVNNSGIVESDIKEVLMDSLSDSDVQIEVVKTYDKGKSRRVS